MGQLNSKILLAAAVSAVSIAEAGSAYNFGHSMNTQGSFTLASGHGGGNEGGNSPSELSEDTAFAEEKGPRRGGGFLSTAGSITLSSGSGNEGGNGLKPSLRGNSLKPSELSEDTAFAEEKGPRRRGGFLSTAPSFPLSYGSGNAGGNDLKPSLRGNINI
jgi:hypothetical protein